MIQVGFLFTAKPITPDFTRITPRFGRWLSRSFGSPEALFNLAKAMVKIALIAAIAYLNIRGEIPRLTRLAMSPFFSGSPSIAQIAFRILLEAAIALLAFSAIDYWFQRRQHMESLKMSRQEVKEERKMYEGDPLTRSRLRERMREIMRRNMLKAVPKADVVITNPTHYAVALEYNRALMPAPTVVAKGADMIAQRIKEVAAENNVPIMENKPLAQALYREVEIGDVHPGEVLRGHVDDPCRGLPPEQKRERPRRRGSARPRLMGHERVPWLMPALLSGTSGSRGATSWSPSASSW